MLFYGCKNLNNLILPSKLSSVGNYTFTACTNLTNITIKQAEGSVDLSNSGLTEEQIKNIKWES